MLALPIPHANLKAYQASGPSTLKKNKQTAPQICE